MKKLILAALILAAPAYAHDMPGNHGGVVADVGTMHVELVANVKALELYLTDHSNKAVAADKFKATAVLVVEGKVHRIALTPAGGNRLTGNASIPLPARPKGAIQIQTETGASLQGKLP